MGVQKWSIWDVNSWRPHWNVHPKSQDLFYQARIPARAPMPMQDPFVRIHVEGHVQEILSRSPSSRSLWQVSVQDLQRRSLGKISVRDLYARSLHKLQLQNQHHTTTRAIWRLRERHQREHRATMSAIQHAQWTIGTSNTKQRLL